MSASQRNKGACAERELFKLLSEQLGIAVARNFDQTWKGGADTLSVEGWAIECKRVESLAIASWWSQARRPWKAVVDLHHVLPGTFPAPGNLAEIALDTACQIIRESLS